MKVSKITDSESDDLIKIRFTIKLSQSKNNGFNVVDTEPIKLVQLGNLFLFEEKQQIIILHNLL